MTKDSKVIFIKQMKRNPLYSNSIVYNMGVNVSSVQQSEEFGEKSGRTLGKQVK